VRELETNRLLLKPVEKADLIDLLELQWDQDVIKYMKFNPISFADQEAWFNSLGKNMIAFTMWLKTESGQAFFGLTSLNNIDRVNQRATWGMKMKPTIQGKGLGYEASIILIHYGFYHMNLKKIHADFLEENQASLGLVNKIGMRKEGLLIDHIYHRGVFKNVVLVGMLKEEFYQTNTEALQALGLI